MGVAIGAFGGTPTGKGKRGKTYFLQNQIFKILDLTFYFFFKKFKKYFCNSTFYFFFILDLQNLENLVLHKMSFPTFSLSRRGSLTVGAPLPPFYRPGPLFVFRKRHLGGLKSKVVGR